MQEFAARSSLLAVAQLRSGNREPRAKRQQPIASREQQQPAARRDSMTDRSSTHPAVRPVALVTGGTRGIGLGIARALASDGWDLVLSGVRALADVTAIVTELEALGSGVSYIAADISSREARAGLVDDVRRRHGAVNAIVNNAGRAPRVRADLLEATEDSFEELIRTNLQGPYFLTQALSRDIVERRQSDPAFRAAIVFVTSVSAEMASPNRGEYCVSKAGLAMTVKLFAVRLAAHGIPVFEVRPGIISHRHDGRRSRHLRSAYCRWPRPGRPVGSAGGRRARRRRPGARGRALCHRQRHQCGRGAVDREVVNGLPLGSQGVTQPPDVFS